MLLIAIVATMATAASAQRNCGTMDYLQMQMQQDPGLAQRMQDIETYTQNWIQNNPQGLRTVVTIPVVFHVIWNTTAQDISDSQVQAQIAQLNADFARLNSDAGNTPAAFATSAVDCEIQFCLAQQDASGVATNGIIHKNTTKTSFSSNDDIKKNANGGDAAWDASKYLNIWTGNLSGGLLGYAQFPGGNATTDGVVVLYSSVGSIASPGTAFPYAYGRTATHEVGHWVNLFHIWGDDGTGCSGSDQVSDTPNQAGNNFGCPVFPKTDACTSGNGVMFMNYMDYTDDGCMNMFTAGQKTRMQALFTGSGARVSIVTSPGCVVPGGGGCGLASGLSASSITTTTATLNWSVVSGASSYNVQYRKVGNATWTSTTSTTNSKAITGLVASTQYEFQIQTVCATSSSAFTASVNFTTLSSGGSCAETDEQTNNQKKDAVGITVGVDKLSQISTTTDNDWWSFSNTSSAKNIKVTLTTLPADYDIKLYGTTGQILKTSENSGTSDETIIYNTSTVGLYKLKVYGWSGAHSTTQCYTLHVDISSSPFRFEAGVIEDVSYKSGISVYPNPATNNVTVQFTAEEKSDAILNVFNMLGQRMSSNAITAIGGQNNFNLDVSNFVKGNYMIEIISGDQILHTQFIVSK